MIACKKMQRLCQRQQMFVASLFLFSANLVSCKELRNRFANGGCLHQKLENWTRTRVCGSDDPPEAEEMGYCHTHEIFDYMEIRIHAQNWESVFFETWILQILLSEILGVPTSVETGTSGVSVDFYDFDARFEYGNSDDEQAILTANRVGDCREVNRSPEDYESCAHIIPEVWAGQFEGYDENNADVQTPIQEFPLGTIGQEHWFIPKFTAERDPSLTSYVGMQGEKNRKKLADRFLRPTPWEVYCDEISPTQCLNDTVAVRAPEAGEVDGTRFFVDGLYTGHFRPTDKNDCESNPTSCTGHIFNYPCYWVNYVMQQAYHLGINVEGDGTGDDGGYSYGELVDALKAANATKSDILIYWWSPEALYSEFIGTDMELTRLTLPPVTQECLDHRITHEERCSSSFEDRVGDPRGACGAEPVPLRKIVASTLYGLVYDDDIEESLQSPAYEALRSFAVSGAEIGELLQFWRSNLLDPREGICEWVVQNMDKVETFIPISFPRAIEKKSNELQGALKLAGIIVSCMAVCIVGATSVLIFRQRHRQVFRIAQLEFICFLLVGLALVSIGSLLVSLPPTSFSCVTALWSTNIGYTLELIPLIVKMAAIQRIISAAKRLRHVQVNRNALIGLVVIVTSIVVIFLTVWTSLDPARKRAEFELTTQTNQSGETVVWTACFCASQRPGWRYASVGWHMGMLVVATIQAFQTRNVRQEINESRSMAMMIYSHFVFVCLRVVTLLLEPRLGGSDMESARALIFSLDCIATVGIYFFPKFGADGSESAPSEHMIESQTVKQLRMLAAIATAQHERQRNRRERQEGTPESPGKRLSLPTDDFVAHLHDVDTAALVQSMSRKGTIPPIDLDMGVDEDKGQDIQSQSTKCSDSVNVEVFRV